MATGASGCFTYSSAPKVRREALQGHGAAQVAPLAIEEAHVRVAFRIGRAHPWQVVAVARGGDRGTDELRTHDCRPLVVEVGFPLDHRVRVHVAGHEHGLLRPAAEGGGEPPPLREVPSTCRRRSRIRSRIVVDISKGTWTAQDPTAPGAGEAFPEQAFCSAPSKVARGSFASEQRRVTPSPQGWSVRYCRVSRTKKRQPPTRGGGTVAGSGLSAGTSDEREVLVVGLVGGGAPWRKPRWEMRPRTSRRRSCSPPRGRPRSRCSCSGVHRLQVASVLYWA